MGRDGSWRRRAGQEQYCWTKLPSKYNICWLGMSKNCLAGSVAWRASSASFNVPKNGACQSNRDWTLSLRHPVRLTTRRPGNGLLRRRRRARLSSDRDSRCFAERASTAHCSLTLRPGGRTGLVRLGSASNDPPSACSFRCFSVISNCGQTISLPHLLISRHLTIVCAAPPLSRSQPTRRPMTPRVRQIIRPLCTWEKGGRVGGGSVLECRSRCRAEGQHKVRR